MANPIKRIGVLTSGGDSPGMNAAVRAVVRTAVSSGIQCVGIRRGWQGLINSDFVQLDAASVGHIISRGGTMLYTARSEDFMTEKGRLRAVSTCKMLGLDGIVAIGGDGTFRGALELSRLGVPVVGIPATIDNDIGCTNYTIGFDTACNTAIATPCSPTSAAPWWRSWAATRASWRCTWASPWAPPRCWCPSASWTSSGT